MASKLLNTILNSLRPYMNYILYTIIFIIFLVVTILAYKKYAVPAINKSPFTDVANASKQGQTMDIFFFFADWCPHCKKAKPEWQDFMTNNDGKVFNGTTLKCHTVDCTDDSSTEVVTTNMTTAQMIKQYNIEGYPTIKLIRGDGTVYDYDSKITRSSLETFVTTVASK
jgi:thiol-disulfide isomerase/thioredoxin